MSSHDAASAMADAPSATWETEQDGDAAQPGQQRAGIGPAAAQRDRRSRPITVPRKTAYHQRHMQQNQLRRGEAVPPAKPREAGHDTPEARETNPRISSGRRNGTPKPPDCTVIPWLRWCLRRPVAPCFADVISAPSQNSNLLSIHELATTAPFILMYRRMNG